MHISSTAARRLRDDHMAHRHLVLAAWLGQQSPDAGVPFRVAVLSARVLGERRLPLEVLAQVQALRKDGRDLLRWV